MKPNSQIILYQSECGRPKLDVRLDGQTVWLSQKQPFFSEAVKKFGKFKKRRGRLQCRKWYTFNLAAAPFRGVTKLITHAGKLGLKLPYMNIARPKATSLSRVNITFLRLTVLHLQLY